MKTQQASTGLSSTAKIIDEIVTDLTKRNKEVMEQLNLTEPFCNRVAEMSDEEIGTISLSDINELFRTYGGDDSKIIEDFAASQPNISAIDKWKSLLTEIRDAFSNSKDAENTKSEMVEAALNIKREQEAFLHSRQYIDAYNDKIERLKFSAMNEEDALKRKELLKTIDCLKKATDLTFLLERFEANPETEVERTLSIFFSNRKSEYALKRYQDHMRRLGFSETFHIQLFNIEETALPEEYHPYNNFFLYYVMLVIAYMDVNSDVDKTYVASILTSLNSLTSGDIDDGRKEVVVGIIKRFYSYIITADRTEYFKENNKLWKNHPYRIEIESQRKRKAEESALRMEILKMVAKHPGAGKLADGKWINGGMLDKLNYEELETVKMSVDNFIARMTPAPITDQHMEDDEAPAEESGDEE